MGHIRKEELHESLINELEELANIDLSGKQDKTDESLLTESKDLVGAINELFQSANNGKELIASAIGEPVSAEDTFSAMSNDINGLLSTFKTNMMNNGITVESSDKFKSLIDKIATMVEEGEGKGIQMVSGTIANVNSTATSYTTIYGDSLSFKTVTLNLSFEPYMLLIENVHKDNIHVNRTLVICNGNCADSYVLCGVMGNRWSAGMNAHTLKISTQLIGEVTLPAYFNTNTTVFKYDTSTPISWYAIGVGEEDTTLRDSLASILEDEGVSVTEEDDMASLISKVDEEFSKDNNTINNLTNELSGKVTPAGTATAGNVLTGQTFINSTGQLVTGTMANNGTKTVTPSASNQTLGAGYYNVITINGDADLVAANIVSGKNIFGVNGSATITSLGGSQVYKTSISATTVSNGGTLNYNCPFTPSIILLNLSIMRVTSGGAASEAQNVWVSNLYTTTLATEYSSRFTNTVTVSNVTSTSCKFTYNSGSWSSAPTVNYIICIK